MIPNSAKLSLHPLVHILVVLTSRIYAILPVCRGMLESKLQFSCNLSEFQNDKDMTKSKKENHVTYKIFIRFPFFLIFKTSKICLFLQQGLLEFILSLGRYETLDRFLDFRYGSDNVTMFLNIFEISGKYNLKKKPINFFIIILWSLLVL